MLGAIIGDIIGSVYEVETVKTTDFPLFSRFSHFTDDTVLTLAVADAVLHRDHDPNRWCDSRKGRRLYAGKIRYYARQYPNAGYGQMFWDWVQTDSLRGYRSYGNGAAMRVSPIGLAVEGIENVLYEAKLSASVTHSHREGIKGAQAIASVVYLARKGATKPEIKTYLEKQFKYDLSRRLDDIRPSYVFNSAAKESVPPAIITFLESDDYEDAVRKAVSLGGDSDTIASMAGAIAYAFYKYIPDDIIKRAQLILDAGLRAILREFMEAYPLR